MGILPSSNIKTPTPSTEKRKSIQTDFSKLGPLKNTGTKGFSSYRDKMRKAGAKTDDYDDDAMDSDDDDRSFTRDQDDNDDDDKLGGDERGRLAKDHLDPEDAMRSDEVAEGLKKIKVSHAGFLSLSEFH